MELGGDDDILNVKLSNAKILKKLFSSMAEDDLVKQANLDCTEDSMSMESTDTSHIAIFSWTLLKDAFEEFQVKENQSFGISLISMNKILKFAGDSDDIHIYAQGTDVLKFKTLNSATKQKTELNLNLLDIYAEKFGKKDLEDATTVQMSSIEFAAKCRALVDISDEVCIGLSPDKISFTCKGDLGNVTISLPTVAALEEAKKIQEEEKTKEQDKEKDEWLSSSDSDDDEQRRKRKRKKRQERESKKRRRSAIAYTEDTPTVKMDCKMEFQVKFSLKYLTKMSKATTISPQVTLKFAPEKPMIMSCVLADEHEKNIGEMWMALSPKFEDDTL